MSNADFQLKGSTITVVVLDIYRYLPDSFSTQLEQKILQAPQFFANSPVLINVGKLVNDGLPVDFRLLIKQCSALGLQPVGFKGASDELASAIADTGLASLPDSSASVRAVSFDAPEPAIQADPEVQVEIKTVVQEKVVQRPSKVITRPVRSGQQVYAEGADLIVLSQVSEGAEVLADGNIHVYGALRGRALAGVYGDTEARIFCQQMDAELVSVAGNFLLSESLDESIRKQSAQVYLQDDTLKVIPL
ncbi:Septum site-determining protein MinC [gamma proteobacterium IMCC2047]|nr:Septum site-determining protein MinC [gamma proteobacterium IMCC2047]